MLWEHFLTFFHGKMAHEQCSVLHLLGSKVCPNRHADAQCNLSCTQRLQHKLIRVFDSGCLYWQNQQGIGHCVGGGGGSGGGACLVRNWFSLGLRQGWKVVALAMTPPQMSQWTFFVHLCLDNIVGYCLSCYARACMFVGGTFITFQCVCVCVCLRVAEWTCVGV